MDDCTSRERDTLNLFCSPVFPQPPLEFYLLAIASQKWEKITILTAASQPEQLNPSYLALETMARSGVLGENVVSFKVGSECQRLLNPLKGRSIYHNILAL